MAKLLIGFALGFFFTPIVVGSFLVGGLIAEHGISFGEPRPTKADFMEKAMEGFEQAIAPAVAEYAPIVPEEFATCMDYWTERVSVSGATTICMEIEQETLH